MSEFDEWYEKEALNGWVDKEWMMIAFEAGQQSQQVKIDELQARIDEALKEMKHQLGDEDYDDMQRPDYDATMYALRNIKDILKGNKDD